MKQTLILGAGRVVKPMVDYLLNWGETEVVLASRTVEKAQKILNGRQPGRAVPLLVDNDKKLENLISGSNVVVSLLPYTYHVKVANYCLKHQLPLVTTSYVSAQMKALDKAAREKGIVILNEIGLDPGIDHMSAMRIIHNVEERGGKVVSFLSYCGGLPAPESNTNPWGYKFSWSPRGVLMAGRNDARYKKDGRILEIDGRDLFTVNWPIEIDHLQLETYPNRNSLLYIDLYNIPDASTMFRGTLRYPGWCHTMSVISKVGLLTETEILSVKGFSRREVFNKILGSRISEHPAEVISRRTGISRDDEAIRKLDWLGAFSDERFNEESTTPIDFLGALMNSKMGYASGERDMIVMFHDFIAEFPDRKENITSALINYGESSGDSAMSRAVSLPAAIAVRLLVEGKIQVSGVHIPVLPEIYNPVLNELEKYGIICREKTIPI